MGKPAAGQLFGDDPQVRAIARIEIKLLNRWRMLAFAGGKPHFLAPKPGTGAARSPQATTGNRRTRARECENPQLGSDLATISVFSQLQVRNANDTIGEATRNEPHSTRFGDPILDTVLGNLRDPISGCVAVPKMGQRRLPSGTQNGIPQTSRMEFVGVRCGMVCG
jgi:hypothetical protein